MGESFLGALFYRGLGVHRASNLRVPLAAKIFRAIENRDMNPQWNVS